MIRPFIYVREKSIRQFCGLKNLPALINTNLELTKERQRAKQLLAQQEILFPKLYSSLRSSIHPLLGFHEASMMIKTAERSQLKENDDSDAATEEEPPLVTH